MNRDQNTQNAEPTPYTVPTKGHFTVSSFWGVAVAKNRPRPEFLKVSEDEAKVINGSVNAACQRLNYSGHRKVLRDLRKPGFLEQAGCDALETASVLEAFRLEIESWHRQRETLETLAKASGKQGASSLTEVSLADLDGHSGHIWNTIETVTRFVVARRDEKGLARLGHILSSEKRRRRTKDKRSEPLAWLLVNNWGVNDGTLALCAFGDKALAEFCRIALRRQTLSPDVVRKEWQSLGLKRLKASPIQGTPKSVDSKPMELSEMERGTLIIKVS